VGDLRRTVDKSVRAYFFLLVTDLYDPAPLKDEEDDVHGGDVLFKLLARLQGNMDSLGVLTVIKLPGIYAMRVLVNGCVRYFGYLHRYFSLMVKLNT
jgi:hypothetical protein